MSALRLITLDLDDTLWPCAPVIAAAERAVHGWLARHAPRLAAAHDIEALRAHRQHLAHRQPEIAHDLGEVRRRSLAELLERFGYPPELAERGLRCFLDHRNRVEPYTEVRAALHQLGKRYRLISLTNGNAEVAATPLGGLFTHDLGAAEVGAAKPDPALFEAALALADCAAHEALHIGDDPVRDVEAARRCGFTTVWLDRADRQWPAELEAPALMARDLDAVIAWLDAGQRLLSTTPP